VTVADEGEDGFILEVPQDAKTRLPQGSSLLQLKTTTGVSALKKELPKEVKKGRPQKVLKAGGRYIVVWSQDATGKELDAARKSLTDALPENQHHRVEVWAAGVIEELCQRNPAILLEMRLAPIGGILPFNAWQQGQTQAVRAYYADEARSLGIEALRKALTEPSEPRVAHVIGDAGVGKSRLVREALNLPPIRDQVVVGSADSVADFARYIIGLPDAHCILFADEVDVVDIDRLEKLVMPAAGRIRLITAGLTGAHRYLSPTAPDLALGPLGREEMKGLVLHEVGLPPEQAEWVVNISEGYPRLAVEVARLIKLDPSANSLGRAIIAQSIGTVLERMLPQGELRDQLGVLALFKAVGVEGGRDAELKAVASAFSLDPGVLKAAVEGEVGRFVSKAGGLRSVTPQLVAVWLASRAIRSRGSAIRPAVAGLPLGLRQRFQEQLTYLRDAPAIVDVVEDLLEEFSPGESADFDEAAASFLRAAAAVAPKQVAVHLEEWLSRFSDADLLKESFPRRDVVWTLEILLWWEETFESAAGMLLRLASAESEAWANNASAVFAGAFQVHLGGTLMPFQRRLDWLWTEAVQTSLPPERVRLLGDAARAALRTNESRTSSVDPNLLEEAEWMPQTEDEALAARRGAWQLLVYLVGAATNGLRAEMVERLATSFQGACLAGLGPEAVADVRGLSLSPEERSAFLDPLKRVLELDMLPPPFQRELELLRDYLIGFAFADRLAVLFRTRLWDLRDDDERDWQKLPGVLRRAVEETLDDPSRLGIALDVALDVDDSNTAYAFFHELALRGLHRDIAAKALERDEPVVTAFQAALRGGDNFDASWVDDQLEAALRDSRLQAFLVDFVQAVTTTDDRARLVLNAARSGTVPRDHLAHLLYGASVVPLQSDLALELIEEAAAAGTPVALEHALGILHQYADAHPEMLRRPPVRRMAIDTILLALRTEGAGAMTHYHAFALSRSLPAQDALRALRARIIPTQEFLHGPEHELLEDLLQRAPRTTGRWIQSLLAAAVTPPYQPWALWIEELALVSRAADALGVDVVLEWLFAQSERKQMFLIRHLNWKANVPDEVTQRLLEEGRSDVVAREAEVAFWNSLGTVVGPYYRGLELQLARARVWQDALTGRGRVWAARVIRTYEQQIPSQRDEDLEREWLFR
jgi:hypothetical protein